MLTGGGDVSRVGGEGRKRKLYRWEGQEGLRDGGRGKGGSAAERGGCHDAKSPSAPRTVCGGGGGEEGRGGRCTHASQGDLLPPPPRPCAPLPRIPAFAFYCPPPLHPPAPRPSVGRSASPAARRPGGWGPSGSPESCVRRRRRWPAEARGAATARRQLAIGVGNVPYSAWDTHILFKENRGAAADIQRTVGIQYYLPTPTIRSRGLYCLNAGARGEEMGCAPPGSVTTPAGERVRRRVMLWVGGRDRQLCELQTSGGRDGRCSSGGDFCLSPGPYCTDLGPRRRLPPDSLRAFQWSTPTSRARRCITA